MTNLQTKRKLSKITDTNGMTERASQELSRHWQTLPALTIEEKKEEEKDRGIFFFFFTYRTGHEISHICHSGRQIAEKEKNERNGFITGGYDPRPK